MIMSNKKIFKTIGDLVKDAENNPPLSLKQNIETLLDIVYDITHEFSDSEVIRELESASNRGRKLNGDILKRIITFQKTKC